MRCVMLSTVDNPYDYFDDFHNWFAYDTRMNHNSCGFMARLLNVSDSLTDEENMREQERVIDDIIKFDELNFRIKVVRELDSPKFIEFSDNKE